MSERVFSIVASVLLALGAVLFLYAVFVGIPTSFNEMIAFQDACHDLGGQSVARGSLCVGPDNTILLVRNGR